MTFQIGTGLLDASVLAVLLQGDSYGYLLTQTLKETLGISESTLYPVLRRLQKDGLLSVYDAPYQGRNRRYYSITDSGRSMADFNKQEWLDFRERIDRLLLGKSEASARSKMEGGLR